MNSLEKLISTDCLAEAISLLLQTNPPTVPNTISILKRNLFSLEKEYHLGLVTPEQYQVSRSKIAKSILFFSTGTDDRNYTPTLPSISPTNKILEVKEEHNCDIPEKTKSSNSFFTQLNWSKTSTSEIEKSLKTMLLLNDTLVIPEIHIIEPRLKGLLEKHQILFDKNCLKIALEEKRGSFFEYGKKHRGNKEVDLSFIKKIPIEYSFRYSKKDAKCFFASSFRNQLLNKNSVLRKSLRLEQKEIANIFDKVDKSKEQQIVAGNFRTLVFPFLNGRQKNIIASFVQLLFYTSGAKSINCHSFIPQENFLETTLVHNQLDKILDEKSIFYEIFLESIIDLTANIEGFGDMQFLNENLINRLSFQNILELRNDSIMQDGFMNVYRQLIEDTQEVKAMFERDEYQLENLEELISLKSKITLKFREYIKNDVNAYQSVSIMSSLAGLITTIASELPVHSARNMGKSVGLATDNRQISKWKEIARLKIIKAEEYSNKVLKNNSLLTNYMKNFLDYRKRKWYL